MARKAGMKTGTEVARITVKVSPDTTRFREELRNQLLGIRKDLDKYLEAEPEVNTKPAEKKVEKSADRMGKKLDKVLVKRKFKLNVAKDIRDSIADLNKISGKFDIDTTKFDLSKLGKDFNRSLAQLDKAAGVISFKFDDKAKADADREIERMASSMKKKMGKLDLRWDKKMRDFKLGPISGERFQISRMRSELEMLEAAAEKANERLDNVFNKSSKGDLRQALREYVLGFRDMDYYAQRTREHFNKIGAIWGRTAPSLNKGLDFARSRGGLIGALLGGAGAIAGMKEAVSVAGSAVNKVKTLGSFLGKLTPSLGTGINVAGFVLIGALITPVLALLSGLLTAAPAALAAIAVPIGTIALGVDGIKKAAETAGPAFAKLREDVSGVFEKSMIPGFTAIRDTLIPGMTESLKGNAESISNLFNGFAKNLSSETNIGYMKNIVDNVGEAAERAIPGVQMFTDGILKLVSTLSNKFPGLSDALNRTAESFVNWVDKITTPDSNGVSQLDRAMETLGETLSGLGGIISDLFSNGFNNLSNPGFGKSMTSFVDSIRQLVTDVLPALSKSFQTIATALKPIADLVSGISKGVDLFNGATGLDKVDLPEPKGMNMFDRMQFLWDSAFNPDEARKRVLETVQAVADTTEQQAPQMVGAADNAGKQYAAKLYAELAGDKEKQRELIRSALTGEDISQAVEAQITQQSTKAIDGAMQMLAPLKANLQGEIDAILQPLGDIAGRAGVAFDNLGRQMGSVVEGILPTVQEAFRSVGSQSVDKMVDELRNGAGKITGAVGEWPPAVSAALEPLAAAGVTVANQLVTGLVAGINNGIPAVTAAARSLAAAAKVAAEAELGIKSPSRVFKTIGEQTGEGMRIGLENGFEPVFQQAQGLAGKIADIMSVNGDPTAALSGYSNKDVDRIEKVLGFQQRYLATQSRILDRDYRNTKDESLKQRSDELKAMQDQLSMQKELIGLSQEFAELQNPSKSSGGKHPFIESIEEIMKLPNSFASATRDQFLSDVGISGNGAIPAVADWAMGAASNFIFNVSNIDEAMAVQRNQVNKQAQGVVGR